MLKNVAVKFYNGFTKTKLAIILLVIAIYIALADYGGGGLRQLAIFALAVLFYIVGPGVLVAYVLKADKMVKGYFAPLSILLGTGFLVLLYCFCMRLGFLWLLRIVPPLGTVVLAVLLIKDKKIPTWHSIKKNLKFSPHIWMLLMLFAAVLLLYTFAGVVKNARPAAVGDTFISQDLLWNAGNANSFKIQFPPEDIRFFDVRLHYHYLTELLAGILSIVSGINAFNIVAFYMQPYMLAALVLCLYRFGMLFFKKNIFKSCVFTYSFFLFGCASLWKILPNGISSFWNTNTTHLITNINSQATALVYLSIFLGLWVEALRKKFNVSFLYILLLLVSFIMLNFAKGPVAAIVACALVLVTIIGLFQKQANWKALFTALVIGGLFVFIYMLMFSSGANDSMHFSFVGTLEKGYFYNLIKLFENKNYYMWLISIPVLYIVQTFLMIPAQFVFYVKGGVKDLKRFAKAPGERLLAHAAAIGGLLAFFLFNHQAMSQVYFIYTAIFFINLVAVDEFAIKKVKAKKIKRTEQKLQKNKTGKRILAFATALFVMLGFVTTAFLYTNIIGSGARRLVANLGFIEKYPYNFVMTLGDEEAMNWLAENTSSDIMFATNRTHTGAQEGISNLYSGLSGRQAFMEGHQYAQTNMGVSLPVIHERMTVNSALFSQNTAPEEVERLCREYGIDYLVFSTQFEGETTQLVLFDLVYDFDTVRIYKLPEKV